MKKISSLLIVLIFSISVLSACNTKATPEQCAEFIMEFDFESFEKRKCSEHLEG